MIWSSVTFLALMAIAFVVRGNTYELSIVSAVLGVSLTGVYSVIRSFDRITWWSVVKAGTIYRRSPVRVSMAYLVCIRVEDEYLLVRGNRIRTQFQPVGGVFKTDLTASDLYARFRAEPDNRFKPDLESQGDLRLRLPGGSLQKFLRWFRRGSEREILPTREFYEELVVPGVIDSTIFGHFDCRRMGIKSFPLRFDKQAGCQQLILVEIWSLRPNGEQTTELQRLKRAKPRVKNVYFASRDEMISGGRKGVTKAHFDISPTCSWLVGV